MINMLITAIVQVVLFSALPFIWWLVTARKKMSFFAWLGLKKVENTKKDKTLIWTAAAILGFLLVAAFMLYSVRGLDNVFIASQWNTTNGGLPTAVTQGRFAVQKMMQAK